MKKSVQENPSKIRILEALPETAFNQKINSISFIEKNIT